MDETAITAGPDWRPNTGHWGIIMKVIHWLMALMIIGMLVVGTIMTDLDDSEFKFELYQLHKSFGFTVMALALIRLFIRVPTTTPPLPVTMNRIFRVGAHLSHVALYGLMFAMPLSGWLMVSASTLGIPTFYFGLFEIPHLVEPDEDLAERMVVVHETLAWAFAGVLVLHTCAAVKHHLIDRDTVLSRMLPGRSGH